MRLLASEVSADYYNMYVYDDYSVSPDILGIDIIYMMIVLLFLMFSLWICINMYDDYSVISDVISINMYMYDDYLVISDVLGIDMYMYDNYSVISDVLSI